MSTTVGIDEAGRGPVIGPMVMAGVLANEELKEKFTSLGIKDSKLLSAVQRERLFGSIKELALDFEIVVVSPEEIDAAVESPTTNLNWLEAHIAAKIINRLKGERAIVDAPSPNLKAYSDFLLARLDNKETRLVVEHKADLNHVECAAASILAKVVRDAEIEKIKKLVGVDFGSGYAADPRTRAFLAQGVRTHPGIFRKSWKTYRDAVASSTQHTLSGFGGT